MKQNPEAIGGRIGGPTRWSRPRAGVVQGSLGAAGATCHPPTGPLSVAFDATPLLGLPTGVGTSCTGAALSASPPSPQTRGVGVSR